MSSLLVHGAHKVDADGESGGFWFHAEDGTIRDTGVGEGWRGLEAHETVDAEGAVLTPGFLDLHAHGGGGHAFDDGPDEIARALAVHRRRGTTRSVVSLVANPVPRLAESLAQIAGLAARDPLVLGSHLEGPFLAPERRGAHNADHLIAPDREAAESLLDAANGTLRHVTLAPELEGALELVHLFTGAGARVAVGHTDASADETRAAFDAGASILTHAFNAMPGLHHRDPGPLMAAIGDERVTIELILDGLHVHPDVAALLARTVPGRLALVTDAMAAAGSDDGHYRLGSLNVSVADGVAVLSGTDTIAGSTLTLDTALRLAVTRLGLDPVQAVTALTLTPARALGLEARFGRLRPGAAADAVLLGPDWDVRSVWADGARVTA